MKRSTTTLISSMLAAGLVAAPMAAHAAPSEGTAEMPSCTLTVQHPHASTHVSGTINVVAVTSCPIPMSSIYVDVELLRVSPSPKTWWNGVGVTSYASTRAQDNQATSCSAGPGTYRGWATTKIVPPPGYVLTGPGNQSKYGAAVAVACGVSAKTLEPPQMESATVLIEYERVAAPSVE
jgi:hypothetical protein